MPSRNARCAAVEAVRGEDIRPGYAQELHGEAGLEAIEIGAVDHQSRRLVDRDDDVVAVEDLEQRGLRFYTPGIGRSGPVAAIRHPARRFRRRIRFQARTMANALARRETMKAAGTPGRIPQLEGLRGTAIALVIVWHYFVCVPGAEASPLATFVRRLFYLGWSGVDLFFVLSGFLIGGILLDNRESPRYFSAFYTRRVFRIVPVYLMLVVPFWAARASVDANANPALFSLLGGGLPDWSYGLFLQNVFMAWEGQFGAGWMGVTWSLAVEEQFYLALPLVLFFVPRRFVPHLCFTLAAAALASRTALTFVSPSASSQGAAYVLLSSRMDGLFLGLLGAWLLREEGWRRRLAGPPRWLWWVLGVMGAGVGAASFEKTNFVSPLMTTVGYSWLAVFYLAALLACLGRDHGPLHAVMTWWPLRALGQVSYFVYLFHHLFLMLAHYAVFGGLPQHHSPGGVVVTSAALVLVLGTAALSWRFLEQPLLEEGRKARY